jgi:hypothetical protein
MALTAEITYEVQSDGTKILFEDTTTYGNGTTNPTRAQSLVAFQAFFMRDVDPQEITINYDPETATQVLVDINSDGWYRLYLTITKDPDGGWAGGNYSYQAVTDLLVVDRYCICLASFMTRFLNCICGCESPEDIQHLMEMQARYEGIVKLVAQNDMNSADQSLQVLEKQCALYNTDCGC